MFTCKYCKNNFDSFTTSQKANHSRWCVENPNRNTYNKDTSHLRTVSAKAKRSTSLKQAHIDGKYSSSSAKRLQTRKDKNNLRHSDATKELIRSLALASKHRRLVRSIRNYTKKDGTIVTLDSSWEEALAQRLDDINIEWVRPETPIEYTTPDNKVHNYFPDFYLPKYNLFLDPKNPAALKAQEDKINILLNIMSNLIIINTLEDCKNFNAL